MLVVGAATNVSWGLDIFEESAVATGGSSEASTSGSLPSDLDIGTVSGGYLACFVAGIGIGMQAMDALGVWFRCCAHARGSDGARGVGWSVKRLRVLLKGLFSVFRSRGECKKYYS